jgi:hypothetical protein
MNTATSVPPRLAITYRRVGDLIPDPRNARTHPKRQIEQVRASIATSIRCLLTPTAESLRAMAGFRQIRSGKCTVRYPG